LAELILIRWQSCVLPLFAFYKNFSLLFCFAGLGIGYILAKDDDIPLFLTIPLLTLQMLVLMFIRHGIGHWDEQSISTIMTSPFVEQLNFGLPSAGTIPAICTLYFLFLTVFLLSALAFIPIGQLCGRLMRRRGNLPAYGLNVLGSLFGVGIIFMLSFFLTPPVIWFITCFSIILLFQSFSKKNLLLGIICSFAALTALVGFHRVGVEETYSPYQMIVKGQTPKERLLIQAAGHYYQRAYDLSFKNANRDTDPVLRRAAIYYEFPYSVLGHHASRVAIIGAGLGNDVAGAIRMGAAAIDAVEIDPVIYYIGRLCHPESPYYCPWVRGIINDGRTFLKNTHEKYDVIVFALLDSHTLLSHASSVRLDSFIYTVESIRQARLCLNDDGVLSLSFSILSPEIARKIYLMMTEAFDGIPPIAIDVGHEGAIVYVQRKNGGLALNDKKLAEIGIQDVSAYCANPAIKTDVPTDDWPFFYMPRRVYPISYVGALTLILLATIVLVWRFAPAIRGAGNLFFFFTGAGFMLVETKGITELSLTFGNTWQVTGIVIAGILVMAYAANLVVSRFKIHAVVAPLVLLICSLVGGYLVARAGGFPATAGGKCLSLFVLTLPMFFSGILFSSVLSRHADITSVMSFNLMGAMAGGILEYNSMYFGFSFLYLLAIACYILAIFAMRLKKI
ncbi:MAG: hypothetical protein WCG78_07740, partial [Candidatus Omnitrophota bacterium]